MIPSKTMLFWKNTEHLCPKRGRIAAAPSGLPYRGGEGRQLSREELLRFPHSIFELGKSRVPTTRRVITFEMGHCGNPGKVLDDIKLQLFVALGREISDPPYAIYPPTYYGPGTVWCPSVSELSDKPLH